jgi:glycosyltransferase involved in cell wall biosynthesis
MKLSVITLTYNNPEELEKTMASLKPLQEQNFSWEHIVVDSSPEKTQTVLKKLGNWPLVHIETPPKGIYSAFNLGLEHSRGDWVWFLNGGDRMTLFENIRNTLSDTGHDILCAGVKIFRNGEWIYSSIPKEPLIENLLGENTLCHQGMFYKKSIFDEVGAFDTDFKLAGDYDHHFRCYFQNVKTGFSPNLVAEFDRDGRSDNFRPVLKEFRKVWAKYDWRLKKELRRKNRIGAAAFILRLTVMRSPLVRPFSKSLKNIWYKLHRH